MPAPVRDPPLLLDIDVHELAGLSEFVTDGLRSPNPDTGRLIDMGQQRHPEPGQDPSDSGSMQAQMKRDPMRSTETVPARIEDTPAYLDFPGEFSHTRYGEGLFVGYRWYDARRLDVAFPFGHGLSYTTFSYADASAAVAADGDIEVTVAVTNTGDRAGRDVVQVYTSLPGSTVQRAPRELKAFASVALERGETRALTLRVRREDLAYWDIRADRWVVEGGEYTLDVAASSRDIRSSVVVTVDGDAVTLPLSRTSSMGEVLRHPVAGPIVQGLITQAMGDLDQSASSIMPEGVDMSKMMESFPIGRIGMMGALSGDGEGVSVEMIDGLIAMANAPQQ